MVSGNMDRLVELETDFEQDPLPDKHNCANNMDNCVNDGFLQSTYRELRVTLADPRLWIIFAAVVVLFAFTGPFGTFEHLGAAARLGYWLLLQAVAWSICLVCIAGAKTLLQRRLAAPLPRMFVGALVASPLIGAGILATNSLLLGDAYTWAGFVEQSLTAFPVALLMCVFVWLSLGGRPSSDVDRRQAANGVAQPPLAETDVEPGAGRPGRLLERLDAGRRAPLLHLAVEDHYVDVVTTRGHDLLLIRFADALAEVGPDEGMQVHRSHWVADRAVERVVSDNGRLTIHLSTGCRVPVSRPYVAEARSRFADRLDRS